NLLTLAAWQAATGKDANSISADPLYGSTTNLQPQPGSPVIAAGQTIAGITTDILGVARNNPPSIGAYENAQVPPTPTPTLSPTATATPTAFPCTSYGYAQATGVIGTATPTVDTGNHTDDGNTNITLPFPYLFYD